MSYTRNGITVICAANPETTYAMYYSEIEKRIIKDEERHLEVFKRIRDNVQFMAI